VHKKVEMKAAHVCQPKVTGDPWSDMYAVGELEILSEVESVRNRNEPVGLVHDSGVPREPSETTEEFGNNVQGNFDIHDGHDNTTRNTEGYSEENCEVR